MDKTLKLEDILKQTKRIISNSIPFLTIPIVLGFYGLHLYVSSPTYKYNLNKNDKIIFISSQNVGFPVIKDTYGIDRNSDGSIDNYYDIYKAFGGKGVGATYSKIRDILKSNENL